MTMQTKERLASLDILRGFDLFMLVFFEPVFMSLARVLDTEALKPVMYQFQHEPWEGFRCWDMVMPLFMFMAGVAMPFSLSKYRGRRRELWKRVLKRVVILFVLGMVVQGNLLGLNLQNVHIYVNTLQAIAVGYLIATILLTNCSQKGQIVGTMLLLVIYWLPMTFCGDWTPEGNFAYKVDQRLMGRFCGDPTYTWIWSSLTFGVTVMLGAFAGQMMKGTPPSARRRTALSLTVTGIALTLAGWAWSLQMPIIKHLWTCSMTLFAGGISFLLMALTYFVVDVLHISKGLNWLNIYGMNSITAYFLGETINFRSVVASVSYGLEQYLGEDLYRTWLTLGNFLIVLLILRWMYRHRLFIKI